MQIINFAARIHPQRCMITKLVISKVMFGTMATIIKRINPNNIPIKAKFQGILIIFSIVFNLS
jgi:hypothetical protein